MTSAPVPESQNRYAALSVEECNDDNDDNIDTPLKGCHDTSPARAEAKAVNPAGHKAESLLTLQGAEHHTSSLRGETQPTKALGGKSPTTVTPIDTASLPCRTDGTWAKLKDTPCEALLQNEQAAPTLGSPIATVSVESRLDGALENTARLPGQERVRMTPATTPMSARAGPCPGLGIKRHTPENPDGQGRTDGLPGTRDRDRSILPLKEQGSAKAQKRPAAGQDPTSTQAVKRGHQVTCIEVPDEDDDTAFQLWLAKERLPAMARKEATSNEPAQSSTTGNELNSVPMTKPDSRWLKPFDVDWMLRTLRQGGEEAKERLYELHKPPRYLRRRQNGDRDFSLEVQLRPCTGTQTLSTKALIDSGCMSSAINRAFVQQHQLDTKRTSVPIAVYNADGTCNQARDITEFVELRLTISNHSERIDLTVTDLGSKDLYLGHDWLKRHNLVINWEMGTIIFGRCQCVKNHFPLPNADPKDPWDEELEDGDRILAVNMEEEIVI
ncbi:uncharacterized protein ARMOST_06252 [Armillaria ostoyae]|uniref:Uncharacterized protein n=1 Tax=Armillaria ostoyae TaxID=47428 RepID=A0A284R2F5_ARMOS|nr:uncharacterized protein ARMOST_06252 [Armillaria ostoyae]